MKTNTTTRSARFGLLAGLSLSFTLCAQDGTPVPPAQPEAAQPAAAQPAAVVADSVSISEADEYARSLNAVPDPEQLYAYHDLLASAPHDAGTPGDKAVVDELARMFESFGLMVEKQELQLYLSRPVSAGVRVFAKDLDADGLGLSLREKEVEGDSFVGNPEARPGWNAYSGSGEAVGEVVYANYGRLEDFAKLKQLGIDCTGKVVIARYGGNFRGYKAKYAQDAGAVGLIIYTDPQQDGWGKGLSWPEGGYANGTHIQRGSILTLDYTGDPLTPFAEASADAKRLSPEGVALPKIPVQPMGWDAARQILSRMAGEQAPGNWQGGLDFRYRLTGGEALTVRVAVEQVRELTTTWNVIATLPGEFEPEREVIIGAHHDSWGYGASDSMSGMICVVEAARAFGELAQQGISPRRTLRFAGWAAEEHGIIGSAEYVESRARELSAGAVAYINLDMAAMGPNFGASASPSLRRVVSDAARHVPQARAHDESVWQNWVKDPADRESMPSIGNLGGGSDHVGFLCHVCVPSISMHSGGSAGTSYHSTYDNLDWYRAVVGEDYEPALMITRMAVGVAARLAHEPVLPLHPEKYIDEVREHTERLGDGIEDAGEKLSVRLIQDVLRPNFTRPAPGWNLNGSRGEAMSQDVIDRINAEIIAIERSWCGDTFDDGRPWYRNGFVAPDATSGYAAWVLPGIQRGIFTGDVDHLSAQAVALINWAGDTRSRLSSVRREIESSNPVDVGEADKAPDPAGGRFQLETIKIEALPARPGDTPSAQDDDPPAAQDDAPTDDG
ncbi:MAG: N-acetylated-alpha-linked acidic dipeptidase [Phycisphaerales bacterium]|jgi:N-acetylated-alpha-linked acidic dipeptidase